MVWKLVGVFIGIDLQPEMPVPAAVFQQEFRSALSLRDVIVIACAERHDGFSAPAHLEQVDIVRLEIGERSIFLMCEVAVALGTGSRSHQCMGVAAVLQYPVKGLNRMSKTKRYQLEKLRASVSCVCKSRHHSSQLEHVTVFIGDQGIHQVGAFASLLFYALFFQGIQCGAHAVAEQAFQVRQGYTVIV